MYNFIQKHVQTLIAMSALFMCFGSMAHAELRCGSRTYFKTKNIEQVDLLPKFLKDESGLCLDLSESKALFCSKTAHTNIFNETKVFPEDYYKIKPLHENFLDLNFYISDSSGYYEVTTEMASLIDDPNAFYKAPFENGLYFLGDNIGFSKSKWLEFSKSGSLSTTHITLDREKLTMDHYIISSGETALISKDYFMCRVESPAKLLAFRLKLMHSWAEYYANKEKKYKF